MPRTRMGFVSLALLLAVVGRSVAQEAPAPAKAEVRGRRRSPGRSEGRPPRRRDAPGTYMGRRIADVMSYQGADWLIRATREEEEQPEAMLDALKIAPGVDRGRRRRGGRLHEPPPGPAGRARGDSSWPPTSSRRCSGCSPANARTAGVKNIRPIRCTADRPQAPRGGGRPDPDGRRLPRVLRPRGHPAGPAQGPQARRPARPGRVPRRGPRGPDQARAQDDRRAGPPRGRAAGLHLQGEARLPPLAAHHRLREAGRSPGGGDEEASAEPKEKG